MDDKWRSSAACPCGAFSLHRRCTTFRHKYLCDHRCDKPLEIAQTIEEQLHSFKEKDLFLVTFKYCFLCTLLFPEI